MTGPDSEAVTEFRRRYKAAAHGMQTGVAYKMHHQPAETTPKHLRVGVNSAMVQLGALANLLVRKGVISQDEYYQALAEAMETERDLYQDWLNRFYGERGGPTVRLV